MTFAPHIAVRLLVFLICLAGCMTGRASAYGDAQNACMRWPQNRLVIGNDLQSRRFVLDAKGEIEPMPAFMAAEGRSIFHRPFTLSLDVAERISLFSSSRPRTCVVARDQERQVALKIPVFFVGRSGESLEELKENAENVAFAPSESLDIGSNFADISFHLRRGGSRFSEIRPFFLCGLAGLLVCEQSCPADSVTLGASLVNELVKAKPQVSQAPRKEANAPQAIEQPLPQRPETPRILQRPVQPQMPVQQAPAPSVPQTKNDAAPASQPAPCETAVQPAKPAPIAPSGPAALSPQPREAVASPQPPPAPALKPAAQPSEPVASQQTAPAPAEPAVQSSEPNTAPPQPEAQTAPPAPQLRRLVLTFVHQSGEPMQAADVLAAEGELKAEGKAFETAAEGLAVDLEDQAFQKANDPEYLKKLFRRHQVLAVAMQPEAVLLTVEPLYVRADDLTIKILDASGEPVHGCDLALDVSMGRRFGAGWSKTGPKERLRGLEFSENDTVYELSLPENIEANELLISTVEPGNVARLSNIAAGCELEARPMVSVEEIRTRQILRSLQNTGPIFISIFSTDSDFAGSVGPAAGDAFWSDALKLAGAVSTASYERKVLARAQAPGVSQQTSVLEVESHGNVLAGEGRRRSQLKVLSEGSRPRPGALSIFPTRPMERFYLDLALRMIRDDAGIAAQTSVKQEALLIVSGSIRETGSYFCHSVRRDKSLWASPQWVKQARRAFVLEVWSEAAVAAMRNSSRIKPAEGAPDGVFACNIPGADGDKIALYGILATKVSDDHARADAFTYLTAQASAFLKP